jgi:hypothetical protein
MGIFDVFKKKSRIPDGIQNLEYEFSKAAGPDSVNGEVLNYSFRRLVKSGKVVDRCFEVLSKKEIEGEKPHTNLVRFVFCFSPAEYNSYSKSIKENRFTDEDYHELLRHHEDYSEERGLIVRIEKNTKTNKYDMELEGEVKRTKPAKASEKVSGQIFAIKPN